MLNASNVEMERHGFAASRVGDIVESADANLGAVSYYFGGKARLYEATVGWLASEASGYPEPLAPSRADHPVQSSHSYLRRAAALGASKPT